MPESLKIFAPATVANVGPGFDILGFALDAPGDIILLEESDTSTHIISNQSGIDLPEDPSRNVATVALDAYLDSIGSPQKFRVCFIRKIPAGSGIGSSAASSAATVYGANRMLGSPLQVPELVPFAMKGEEAASGSAHADNVAPALMGGFVLIRSYDPLDLNRIPGPPGLHCCVVHPAINIATEDSRKILKTSVPLKTAISQCGNVAGLVSGLITANYRLIRSSMVDLIAEPVRSFLIPEYEKVKAHAMDAGALGCSISGSGPSIFSLCENGQIAANVGNAMQAVFEAAGIDSKLYISKVNQEGMKLLGPEE